MTTQAALLGDTTMSSRHPSALYRLWEETAGVRGRAEMSLKDGESSPIRSCLEMVSLLQTEIASRPSQHLQPAIAQLQWTVSMFFVKFLTRYTIACSDVLIIVGLEFVLQLHTPQKSSSLF